MSDENDLPGISIKEWLDIQDPPMSFSNFSRLIPCSISYPRMIHFGINRPSYEMACRIEEITNGAVPRTRWYPAPPIRHEPDLSEEIE